MFWLHVIAVITMLAAVTGCQAESTGTDLPSPTSNIMTTTVPDTSTSDPATETQLPASTSVRSTPTVTYSYTHQKPDGNRVVTGKGTLPNTAFVDIPLEGEPRWLVAAPMGAGSLWAVVLADGRTQAFAVSDDDVAEMTIAPATLEQMPPLLRVVDQAPEFVVPPTPHQDYSHPAVLDEAGNWTFARANGDLVVLNSTGKELAILEARALPDGRILVDDSARLLLLTEPTTRYDHGVLGDAVEAAAITLIETQPEPVVALVIPIPEPQVVEGLAPIWADLNGDGQREIIATLSSEADGAQIVVFDDAGMVIAAGPAIGRGFRWRHQIAVAPFGPSGELELVDVLTPHIGGVVEFYQLAGNELRIVAQVPGYTSHVIGTRNLDMAAAGDFDGDGRYEVLLPNQMLDELGAIRRTADGAEVAWSVQVGGRVSTNLAAVNLADDSLAVGVGRDDGVLRVWQP